MEDQNTEGKDRETSALSKKSLRQHIRQRKARHTDEELVALSQPIVEAVLADPRFQEAQPSCSTTRCPTRSIPRASSPPR